MKKELYNVEDLSIVCIEEYDENNNCNDNRVGIIKCLGNDKYLDLSNFSVYNNNVITYMEPISWYTNEEYLDFRSASIIMHSICDEIKEKAISNQLGKSR